MHVAQISFFLDPERREPAELLAAWPTLVDVAEAASAAGARVSVLQACHVAAHLVRNDVEYHFVPPDAPAASVAGSAAFRRAVRRCDADVHHVHGLGFPADVATLSALCPGVPILLQDHADRPPRLWRRLTWRRGFSAAAGVAFCAREQADPFRAAALLREATPVFEVPESTARFTPGDRFTARERTGLYGNPCVLWVGHLDANKDPLTVLDGVRLAARELPEMRLFCCFGTAPLEAEVRERIEADAWLRRKVHLLGRVPHDDVQELMRSADLFVLGSHREGSGYSLIEALACGLPPVVTDIPAFRALTGRGAVGWLWPPDDALAFSRALVTAARCRSPAMRESVRVHFEQTLSPLAVGRRLNAACAALVAGRARRSPASGVDAA